MRHIHRGNLELSSCDVIYSLVRWRRGGGCSLVVNRFLLVLLYIKATVSPTRSFPRFSSTLQELLHNTMPLTGHCLCGAVTYTAAVDKPLITAYDHCDDCQRQTGSTYCVSCS
jgi:hypothetical protein